MCNAETNRIYFYLYEFSLLLLSFSNHTLAHDITSFIEQIDPHAPFPKIYPEAENIYIQFVMPDSTKKDAVCDLSFEKKIELCRIIFEVPFYASLGFRLSKIPFYKATLPCIERELTFTHSNRDYKPKTKKQKMYPCFARHMIIRTSFIEDEFYNIFYFSGGPKINSVTIYIDNTSLNQFNYIRRTYVSDFIYNINLSKLNEMFIHEKDVLQELKLTRNVFITSSELTTENNYAVNKKYIEKDPLCDLTYEQKITLCNMIFEHFTNHNVFFMTLNKAASYMYTMNCKTTQIYSNYSANTQRILLKSKQQMFPCYGRNYIFTPKNFLKNVFPIFVSSGHKRNSVFVYTRKIQNDLTEMYTITRLIENINIKWLKPTIITPEDLKKESVTMYKMTVGMTQLTRKTYYIELLNIIDNSNPEEEDRNLNLMVDKIHKYRMEQLEAGEHEQESFNILDKSGEDQPSIPRFSYFTDVSDIGVQVYKRLLEDIRAELKSKKSILQTINDYSDQITSEMRNKLKKKIEEMNQTNEVIMKRDKKLNNKVQELISNMEIKVIENNLPRIQSSSKASFQGSKSKRNKNKAKKNNNS